MSTAPAAARAPASRCLPLDAEYSTRRAPPELFAISLRVCSATVAAAGKGSASFPRPLARKPRSASGGVEATSGAPSAISSSSRSRAHCSRQGVSHRRGCAKGSSRHNRRQGSSRHNRGALAPPVDGRPSSAPPDTFCRSTALSCTLHTDWAPPERHMLHMACSIDIAQKPLTGEDCEEPCSFTWCL